MRWSASLSRSAFRVVRDVVVDVSRAFPGTGYRRQDELPLWVKTFALRLEPSMRARQVAWIRRASYMQIGRRARIFFTKSRRTPIAASPSLLSANTLRRSRFSASARSACACWRAASRASSSR
jgi:hypothetical protein